jgi:hypothetical protein
MDPAYIEAVRLLLEAIPAVFQGPRLAMKGGTAINLFVQDLPRLSIDIDVVFVDHKAPREEALRQMGAALELVRGELLRRGLQVEAPVRMLGSGIQAVHSPGTSAGEGGGEPRLPGHDAAGSNPVAHG